MSANQNRPTHTHQPPPHAPTTTSDGIPVMWNPQQYPVTAQRPQGAGSASPKPSAPLSSWLNVREAMAYAKVGRKLLYHEIAAGRLKASPVGGRREYRLRPEWIDQWLESTATDTAA